MNWLDVISKESRAVDVNTQERINYPLSCNTVFQNFYDRITEIINKHAPIRKLSRK